MSFYELICLLHEAIADLLCLEELESENHEV